MPKSVEREATMKFRMTEVLRFWVDVEYDDVKDQGRDCPGTEVIAKILREFEKAGDAMRYLNADGGVVWKATPRMLVRLADAEREARDELADCP
jgi:hypothetical protein